MTLTDEVLLTRVLRNLLSNALKFTEKGEVRLEFAVDPAASGPWMTFTVTDTGVGIPETELPRVFEEFYQVRGPLQRIHRGTGLGLPYARALTELLGGTLQLSSTPGVGTRVEVRLPHRPGPASAPPPAPHRSGGRRVTETARRDSAPGTILVIDDDETNRYRPDQLAAAGPGTPCSTPPTGPGAWP
ncbi:Autoinducer 2 sensor kinase/phosphatase LuxQ [Streptomyces microflavus]